MKLKRCLILALLALAGCQCRRPPDYDWAPRVLLDPERPGIVYWEGLDHHDRSAELATTLYPCEMFRPSIRDTATVRIYGYASRTEPACAPVEPHATWRDPWGVVHYCGDHFEIRLQVSAVASTTVSYLAIAHLLGHVAGLAHDPAAALAYRVTYGDESMRSVGPPTVSIMAENAPEHANRLGLGMLLPTLTRHDESALRERYCE